MATGSLTNYGAASYLDHIWGSKAKPAHTPYVGWFLSNGTVNGPGTEPTVGNYQRTVIPSNSMTPASGGNIQSAFDLAIPRASDDWGRIVGGGVFDSSIGGNCLAFFDLASDELVRKNGQLVLLAGGLIHRFVSGGLSEYLQNVILDDLYRRIPMQTFPTVYAAGYTTATTTTTPGDEPFGNGYAKVAIANNNTHFGVTVGNVKTNLLDFEFPQATGDWGELTHFGFHTAATGGIYLGGGALESPTDIENLDVFKLGAGLVKLELR